MSKSVKLKATVPFNELEISLDGPFGKIVDQVATELQVSREVVMRRLASGDRAVKQRIAELFKNEPRS